ncbi:uncharacterized protein LOC120691606 isoform X2 [Panicum virgatum]|uniref:uncharacterized protein LOC120691606 isoform X2 n=1 Tax=Panicum virgatum TaxID=38727 RepID=UPI0019D54327|nr:uncharacterized protein LOC120691606 isoform X2 [Panicum virgatum]
MEGEASAPPPPPDAAREDESTCRDAFVEFMTKVARFEELAESGNRFLVRFSQELDYFRRPQIPTESDVMNQILKSNCTGRMRSYLEAGCRLHCQDISNINQLRSCEDGLKDHINKVSDSHSIDSKLTTESCMMEGVSALQEEDKSVDELDSDVSYVTVMVIIRNMLKLDYMMQQRIVSALSIKTPSLELQSYCLMWNLRPYIDDNVMHLAWKMCP